LPLTGFKPTRASNPKCKPLCPCHHSFGIVFESHLFSNALALNPIIKLMICCANGIVKLFIYIQKSSESEHSSPETIEEPTDDLEDQEAIMRRELIAKQQELLSLKQARLELELAETAEKLKKKQVIFLTTKKKKIY
jgi:hypothetical protein